MKRGLVCQNGVLVAPEDAKVSVFDRGFLYGDSVIETMRTYGPEASEPFELSAHLERLARSAERVRMLLPVSAAMLADEVHRALDALRARNPGSLAEGAAVRLWITRGIGPFGPEPGLEPQRLVFVAPLEPLPAERYRRGFSAILFRTERASEVAGGAKVGNYLASILALAAARSAGADDAILVGADEAILEGATSNVFCVRGGKLVTPPEGPAVLGGITRAVLLALAPEAGLEPELHAPRADELADADEAFLSSSLRELAPIVALEGRPIGSGAPGPFTKALHRALRRLAGAPDPAWPHG